MLGCHSSALAAPSARDRRQGNLGLQFRQGRAQAKVDAVAKRELPVLGPANVEAVGIGKLVGVSVGRAKNGGDVLSSRQRDTANGELLAHPPARELHRAVEAQQLSDGGCYQAGMLALAQALPLLGMAQQRQQPIADEV